MSNNHIPEPVAHDDEIDLKELFMTLWAGKKLIIGVTSVFAVLAVIYAPVSYTHLTLPTNREV